MFAWRKNEVYPWIRRRDKPPCPALSASTATVICGAILVALRQAQALPRAEQPTLFELREDRRPPGSATPLAALAQRAERYCEPSLFSRLEGHTARGVKTTASITEAMESLNSRSSERRL